MPFYCIIPSKSDSIELVHFHPSCRYDQAVDMILVGPALDAMSRDAKHTHYVLCNVFVVLLTHITVFEVFVNVSKDHGSRY
jgi:hypothetical protein